MRIFICVLSLVSLVYGKVELKLSRSYSLESGKDIVLFSPGYFDISEEGNIFIPDMKSCAVYNFNSDGSLKEKLGSPGIGPNEFIMPRYCSINGKKLGVFDLKARRVLVYSIGEGKGKLINTIKQTGIIGGEMGKDKLIISGFCQDSDQKEYSLFTYDIKSKKVTPLIPTYLKFGFKSDEDYLKHKFDPELYGFTKSEFMTYNGKYGFLCWVAKLRVIRVDMETGEMVVFGKKTDKYVEPVFTDALKKAVKDRDRKAKLKEIFKFSHVRQLYSNGLNLFVYIASPQVKYVQVYSFDGQFLGEAELPGEVDTEEPYRIGFSRFDGSMYVINMDDSDDKSFWKVHKYKVTVK